MEVMRSSDPTADDVGTGLESPFWGRGMGVRARNGGLRAKWATSSTCTFSSVNEVMESSCNGRKLVGT